MSDSSGPERSRGSVEEFEDDWAGALRTRDRRWFNFPDPHRDEQVALFEWVKAQRVLELLRRRGIRSGRVLEYGCGSAGMAIYLQGLGYRTCGVDRSWNALQVARLNDKAHRLVERSLPLVLADAAALPATNGAFDAVMSNGLLEHFEVESLGPILRDVVRTLRPGGLFIADIIPRRVNARAVGNALNLVGSTAYHALSGRFSQIPGLPRLYFGRYFETSFGADRWEELLREQGLIDVRVEVCRPFPPLALAGFPERAYVRLMRAMLKPWLAFDRSDSAIARQWGWMYLASGVRSG